MNYVALYFCIGAIYGIYGWRTMNPIAMRSKAADFLTVAEKLEHHESTFPFSNLSNSVAALLLFTTWPFITVNWLYTRLYIVIFGPDPEPIKLD